MKKAIIDLGSNTFHLLIIDDKNLVYSTSKAAKLGQGGIEQNMITAEAQERGLSVLQEFKVKIDKYQVTEIIALGTSALRNANNAQEFIEKVQQQLNISIKIISGDEEANLIYLGVKQALEISQNSLIIDIGGGSVEFIICNAEKALWQQSFEIGGIRMVEKFMKKDPISNNEINKLNDYLQIQLLPLINALHQYQCEILIGSSGTFDTLNDMYYQKTFQKKPPKEQNGFEYPLSEFWLAYEQLIFANREERMAIPGMKALRVDLIVVAVCLIKFIIEKCEIKEVKISNFALKEGVLACI